MRHSHCLLNMRIALFSQSTGTNRQLQNKLFDCLASWVGQGGIPPSDMTSNPMFAATFEALKVPELFEVCDWVVRIGHIYKTSHCADML